VKIAIPKYVKMIVQEMDFVIMVYAIVMKDGREMDVNLKHVQMNVQEEVNVSMAHAIALMDSLKKIVAREQLKME
jgi:hypothetical protein